MDAMRFDIFKEIVKEEDIEHKYSPVYSSGCETGMWMLNTWYKQRYPEITLVSNSVIYWKPDYRHILPKFNKNVPLWRKWGKDPISVGEDNHVLPTEEVLEYAEKEHVVTPSKRLLIHDIPPHLPYCTDDGRKFLDKHTNWYTVIRDLRDYGNKNGWKTLRHHYKESARQTLLTILNCEWIKKMGDLIITADHGEMIGEAYTYGHSFIHVNNPVLRVVPWMMVN